MNDTPAQAPASDRENQFGRSIDEAIQNIRNVLKARDGNHSCTVDPRVPFTRALQPRTHEESQRVFERQGFERLSPDAIARTREAFAFNASRTRSAIAEQFEHENLRLFTAMLTKIQQYIERMTKDGKMLVYYGGENYVNEFKGPNYVDTKDMTLYTFLHEVYPKMHESHIRYFGASDISTLISRLTITNVEEFVKRPISNIIRQLEEAGF